MKVPMVRRKNAFGVLANAHKDMEDNKRKVKKEKRLRKIGIVATNEDAEMGVEGATQAGGAAVPVPMAEGAAGASSRSGGAAPEVAASPAAGREGDAPPQHR